MPELTVLPSIIGPVPCGQIPAETQFLVNKRLHFLAKYVSYLHQDEGASWDLKLNLGCGVEGIRVILIYDIGFRQ